MGCLYNWHPDVCNSSTYCTVCTSVRSNQIICTTSYTSIFFWCSLHSMAVWITSIGYIHNRHINNIQYYNTNSIYILRDSYTSSKQYTMWPPTQKNMKIIDKNKQKLPNWVGACNPSVILSAVLVSFTARVLFLSN